jgi:hypothetical protein
MPAADPYVKSVFAKLRNIRQEIGRIVVHCFTGQKPADVSPETALARRMGVTIFICVLVMLTMRRNPKDRTTLESESGAYR